MTGNHHAYSWIYKTYIQDLYRFGMRFTSNKELVKDCIQEVFTGLYKNRRNLILPDNVKVYLFVSLKNCLIRMLQKEFLYESFDSDTIPFSLEPTAEDLFAKKEFEEHQKEQIREILSLLTPRQQEIIYYRYVQELSYDEIGLLMNMSCQSAQNLVQRSLKKIRDNYDYIPLIFFIFLHNLEG